MHGNPYWATVVEALRVIIGSGWVGWTLIGLVSVVIGSSIAFHVSSRVHSAERQSALELLRR